MLSHKPCLALQARLTVRFWLFLLNSCLQGKLQHKRLPAGVRESIYRLVGNRRSVLPCSHVRRPSLTKAKRKGREMCVEKQCSRHQSQVLFTLTPPQKKNPRMATMDSPLLRGQLNFRCARNRRNGRTTYISHKRSLLVASAMSWWTWFSTLIGSDECSSRPSSLVCTTWASRERKHEKEGGGNGRLSDPLSHAHGDG